jgi:hypothetical protein
MVVEVAPQETLDIYHACVIFCRYIATTRMSWRSPALLCDAGDGAPHTLGVLHWPRRHSDRLARTAGRAESSWFKKKNVEMQGNVAGRE